MAEIILQKSGGGVSSDEVTALKSHILAPYTAVTKDSNDEPVAGTIQSMGAQTVTPALGAQTVASSGKYMTGNVTVNPIPNQRGTAVQGVGCGVNANGLYYYIPPGYYQEGANNPWVFMPVVNAANAIGVQSVVSFSVAAYSTTQVICTWRNPSKGPYGGVLICAKAGGYPNSAWDGITYQGVGNNAALNGNSSVVMSGLAPGTTYYFRIWMYCGYNGGTLYSNYLQTTCATTASGRMVFNQSQQWSIPPGVRKIDIFCVGGGGSGGFAFNNTEKAGNGGGGGYTTTVRDVIVSPGAVYTITVGAGGINGTSPGRGGTSSFGDLCVAFGGRGGNEAGKSGSGGGRNGSSASKYGAKGGSDGSAGFMASSTIIGGEIDTYGLYSLKGQGTTTREFENPSATLYSGGGAGGNKQYTEGLPVGGDGGGGNGGLLGTLPGAGSFGTGGGGGGARGGYVASTCDGGVGGSGVVIVSW